MRTWIKFYTEALHDRKMRRLDRFDKSVYYDLLLLAGFEDADGYLPCIDDIAFELDLTEKQAQKSIEKLMEIGVIAKDSNGNLYVTSFTERQKSKCDSYERVKRYRGKKCNVTVTDDSVTKNNDSVTDCNGYSVTPMITTEEEVEEEVEEDTEVEVEKKNNNGAKAPLQPALQKTKKSESKKTEKPKLTPDDDDFWKVFGAERDRAQAFYKATGIYPTTKTEFGRWQKDLPAFTEVKIPISTMVQAVQQIHSEGKITIATPRSVFTTARSLETRKNMPLLPAENEDIWDKAANEVKAKISTMAGINPSLMSLIGDENLDDGDVIDL